MMKAISFIINPLLMPTTMFAVIFYFAPEAANPINMDQAPYMLLIVALTTILLPVISLSTLRFTSTITSFWLEDRRERILPFFFMAAFYATTAYMFITRIKVNGFLSVILITMTLMVLVITIITFYYKISVHSTALSGLVGFIIGLMIKLPSSQLLYPLVGSIMLTGTVMTARLALNAHTPLQILTGALLGLIMGVSSIILFV